MAEGSIVLLDAGMCTELERWARRRGIKRGEKKLQPAEGDVVPAIAS